MFTKSVATIVTTVAACLWLAIAYGANPEVPATVEQAGTNHERVGDRSAGSPGQAPEEEPAPASREAVPSQPPAPSLSLRFYDSEGEDIVGEELRHLFREYATTPTVTVLDENILGRDFDAGMHAAVTADPPPFFFTAELQFDDEATRIAGLPERGTVRLLVTRPGEGPLVSTALKFPLAQSVTLDVPLEPPTSFQTVRFVAADTGDALPNATVSVYVRFTDPVMAPGGTITTNAEGECRLLAGDLGNPQAWPWSIWLEAPDHAGLIHIGRASSETQVVRVPLRGRIEATVTGPDGMPAGDCELALIPAARPGLRIRTGADGKATADGMPATLMFVGQLVSAAQGVCGRAIRVEPGATTRVALGPGPETATITGRVTVAGAPIPGVSIVLHSARGGRFMATTNENGVYLAHVPEGPTRHTVLLGNPARPDLRIKSKKKLELQRGEVRVVDFDLPAGTMAFSVVNLESGEPMANVCVVASLIEDKPKRDHFAGYDCASGWSGTTNPEGRVTLRGLFPGEEHAIHMIVPGLGQTVEMTATASRVLNPEPIEVRAKGES